MISQSNLLWSKPSIFLKNQWGRKSSSSSWPHWSHSVGEQWCWPGWTCHITLPNTGRLEWWHVWPKPPAGPSLGGGRDPGVQHSFISCCVVVLFLRFNFCLGKGIEHCTVDQPVLHGHMHWANSGISSQTWQMQESRGAISLAFLSNTSHVSSYSGDLLKCNIPHHPTVSGLASFFWGNIGFHTNNINKRKAHI